MYPEKTVLANTVTVEADKQSDLLGEKELKAPEGCQLDHVYKDGSYNVQANTYQTTESW